MQYRPVRKNNNAEKITLLCFFIASILLVASAQKIVFLWLFQVMILVFSVVGIQVFLKYILSDYLYELRDGNLVIYRIQGRKSTCLCSLALQNSLSNVLTNTQYSTQSEALPRHTMHYNYCKNIAPKDGYYYYFDFNGKTARLVFEPNGVFAVEMNRLIEIKASTDEVSEDY